MNLDVFITSLDENEKSELMRKLIEDSQKKIIGKTDLKKWYENNNHLLSNRLNNLFIEHIENSKGLAMVMEDERFERWRGLGKGTFDELKKIAESQNIYLRTSYKFNHFMNIGE